MLFGYVRNVSLLVTFGLFFFPVAFFIPHPKQAPLNMRAQVVKLILFDTSKGNIPVPRDF